MKRGRSSAKISGRDKRRKLARTTTIYKSPRTYNKAANYISSGGALLPEVKNSDIQIARQNIPAFWSTIQVTTSGSLITQRALPIIGMGFSNGAKTGSKARLISINLKMMLYMGQPSGAVTQETVRLALVRKGQSNRLSPIINEVWDPAVNAGYDFFRFRNQDFVENYKVLKVWAVDFDPKFEDTGVAFNGIAPYVKTLEKVFDVSDVYENDRTDGGETGNTGACYSLLACSFNGACYIEGQIRTRYQDF